MNCVQEQLKRLQNLRASKTEIDTALTVKITTTTNFMIANFLAIIIVNSGLSTTLLPSKLQEKLQNEPNFHRGGFK